MPLWKGIMKLKRRGKNTAAVKGKEIVKLKRRGKNRALAGVKGRKNKEK
jgi:hypothetical protein